MTVTALLVSHDGARWLPAVLAGLGSQTRPPDRVVAVDTGSTDATVRLLHETLGPEAVLDAPSSTSFGEAVRIGLDQLSQDDPQGWIWLLHDDSSPAPEALGRLLAAAEANDPVSVLGPKLREWPSLRRLLEVGITISGTGRRETGLERGEYDQGQHDRTRQVLAVNTAGMLVRRGVLDELRGFDPRLPVFGNDIDFGWRAARAGHRVLVVPDAVVFHVEAAHRGVRRTALTTARHRRAERRAALYTLLVNCSALALPFQVVRLFFGSMLRALGLLLVRAPGDALDELLALLTTYGRPDRVVSGRAARRRTAVLGPGEVRHLLAAPWTPYRHGLDFASDIAAAAASQAGDAGARRRSRSEPTETGPVPAEAQNLPPDTGLVTRLLTSPVAWVFTVLVILALVGMRGVVGAGMLSGGALLPAPGGATDWWRVYLETWHSEGVGSSSSAAPYLLPLALAGSLMLGKAWLVVDVAFLFAVPLAAWGAYRLFSSLTGSLLPSLWGAVVYGLLPVMGGAVNQGRLGTVVAAAVLPWLIHAATFLWTADSADRRWRAAWRTALWLALVTAFVPLAWLLSLALALLALVVGLVTRLMSGRAERLQPSRWGPVLLAVAMVPLLLAPWTVQLLAGDRSLGAILFEAGLPVDLGAGSVTGWDLTLGRPVELGSAPGWVSLGLVLAALASLLRADTRRGVLVAWCVLAVSFVGAAALSGTVLEVRATGGETPVWTGFLQLTGHAAATAAAVLAATGISRQFAGSSFTWRQPVAVVVIAFAVATPVAGLVWWTVTGVSGPLDRGPAATVPTYMVDAGEADPSQGVLVLRGNREAGLEYVLRRGDGRRVGDDTVVADAEDHEELTAVVADLATGAGTDDVGTLSEHGVEFVYAPPKVDRALAGALDSVSGIAAASAVEPGARAWQVDAEPSLPSPAETSGSARPWLLALQGLAVVAAGVLAVPTRRVRR